MWHCKSCWWEHHNGKRDLDWLTREQFDELHKKTCKKCGKDYPDSIIMNTTELSLAAYFTWRETFRDEMCFDCYGRKDEAKA